MPQDRFLNRGGRYNPESKPLGRNQRHQRTSPEISQTTGVAWTGREMIVWGGLTAPLFEAGGRYCAQSGPPS